MTNAPDTPTLKALLAVVTGRLSAPRLVEEYDRVQAARKKLDALSPTLAQEVIEQRERVALALAVTERRHEPSMPPSWNAAYNAALDAVRAALQHKDQEKSS